jgi:hypothetical protein
MILISWRDTSSRWSPKAVFDISLAFSRHTALKCRKFGSASHWFVSMVWGKFSGAMSLNVGTTNLPDPMRLGTWMATINWSSGGSWSMASLMDMIGRYRAGVMIWPSINLGGWFESQYKQQGRHSLGHFSWRCPEVRSAITRAWWPRWRKYWGCRLDDKVPRTEFIYSRSRLLIPADDGASICARICGQVTWWRDLYLS